MYNFYFISNNIIESDNRNLGFLPQSRGCRSKSVLFVIPSFLLQLHKYWICTFRFWTKDLNLVPCAACMFCYPNYIRLYFASRNAYYTLHSQSHHREVPRWEIFIEQELRFGLDFVFTPSPWSILTWITLFNSLFDMKYSILELKLETPKAGYQVEHFLHWLNARIQYVKNLKSCL